MKVQVRISLRLRTGITGAGPMWATRVAEENKRLLEEQTPYLASEELWAHATAGPEAGGLLLATLQAPAIIGERYWQV